MHALGIDIGGSALKGAPVDTSTGTLLGERFKVETPEVLTPAGMAKVVAQIVEHFSWKGPVGIGFPGVIHGPKILTSANLHKKFIGLDAGKLFGKAAGRPIALLNDAAAAGLAEMTFGVGRKFKGKALLLTLGTGVGSAIFCGGTIVPLELGHLEFKHLDAEKYVAASVRKAEDLSWHAYGKRLRDYIAFLEKAIWPELIVIGGGISAKHDKFFKYIKPRARLVPAGFLNEAGIVGAALWAASLNAHDHVVSR
jgi:polyphosphate glucokinase